MCKNTWSKQRATNSEEEFKGNARNAHIIDIKNAHDKFINKLDKSEESVSELEDRSI